MATVAPAEALMDSGSGLFNAVALYERLCDALARNDNEAALAVVAEEREYVDGLVAKGCPEQRDLSDERGKTMFHLAARRGNNDAVFFLLTNGAPFHIPGTAYARVNEAFNLAVGRTRDALQRHFDRCVTGLGRPGVFEVDFKRARFSTAEDVDAPLNVYTLREAMSLRALVRARGTNLIEHPVCRELIRYKLARYKFFSYLNLAVYVCFLVAFIILVLQGRDANGEGAQAATRIWVYILSAVRIFIEVLQMRAYKLGYVKDVTNILELYVFISAIVLASEPGPMSPVMRDFASVTVVVVFWTLVQFLRQVPLFGLGIHVLMFASVTSTLVRVLPIFVGIILGFGYGFFIGLEGIAFPTFGEALNSSLLMVFGQFDIYELSFGPNQSLVGPKILSVVFVFILPLLLVNFLIGLAVGDIDSVRRESQITAMQLRVEALVFFDPAPLLRRLLPSKLVVSNEARILGSRRLYRALVRLNLVHERIRQEAQDGENMAQFGLEDDGDEETHVVRLAADVRALRSQVADLQEHIATLQKELLARLPAPQQPSQ